MVFRHFQIGDGLRHLAVEGEMDLYNAPEFKEQVDSLFQEGAAGIIIDLDKLEYIDSSGISAMIYTFTQSKTRGVGLRFVNIKGTVQKVIKLTSLDGFLPTAADVDAATEQLIASIGGNAP